MDIGRHWEYAMSWELRKLRQSGTTRDAHIKSRCRQDSPPSAISGREGLQWRRRATGEPATVQVQG